MPDNIPADIRILATLKTGSVYYFEEERLSSREPHYFIVLNKRPKTESVLFLVCGSSQVEKRKNAIQKLGFPEETLVFVSPKECPCFSKETAIDCNTIIDKMIESVIEKLASNELRICTDFIPDEIIKKLVKGALMSTQIQEEIKKSIRGFDDGAIIKS